VWRVGRVGRRLEVDRDSGGKKERLGRGILKKREGGQRTDEQEERQARGRKI
jgi:hypothetical protein